MVRTFWPHLRKHRIAMLVALVTVCLGSARAAHALDPSATVATTSSAIGVDCQKNLGFVALRVLSGSTGNGLVKVLNLGVDPATTDPRVETIDLGHADYPSGVAVDPVNQLVIVVSGNNGHGGFVDLIDESTNPPPS